MEITPVVSLGNLKGCALRFEDQRRRQMSSYSYSERDYPFGQTMTTLRTAFGLTQAELAQLLQISRRAVGGWEAGSSYPKAEHLKVLIELCVKKQTFFSAGQEAEEIRALWRASHQKVLLDEQ